MSDESIQLAGTLLVVLPTVVFGGAAVLWLWTTTRTDYLEHPMRSGFFRAGHGHAGVLLILSLVALLYVDQAALDGVWLWIARSFIPLSAILVPAGYFFSVAAPRMERPNALIYLAYLGAVVLTIGLLTLGVGLLRTI